MLTVLLSFDSHSLKILRKFSSGWPCDSLHCGREVVTKRGWFLSYQIGCFERWCLAQDLFLWGNMFVSCLCVLPFLSSLAQGCVEWLSCRQGWLEDLWDSFIDFVRCVAKPELSFPESTCFHFGTPTFVSAAKQSTISRSYLLLLFFQLPSTTVFCGSAPILGNFLHRGNFLSSVQCMKQTDAGCGGNKREVCFWRICGTWKMVLN